MRGGWNPQNPKTPVESVGNLNLTKEMKSLSATPTHPTAGGGCRVEVYLVGLVELVLYGCLAALAQLLCGNRSGLVLLSRVVR